MSSFTYGKYLQPCGKKVLSPIDNQIYTIINGHFSRHLAQYNLTIDDFYHKYIEEKTIYCKCGDQIFMKNRWISRSCSKKECKAAVISEAHLNRSNEEVELSKQKRIETTREKYGADFVAQLDFVREKIKKTNEEIVTKDGKKRYEVQMEKARATMIEKYDNAYFNGNEKTAKSWQAKSIEEINEIVEKRRKTSLERHGVENYLMHPDMLSKSAKGNATPKFFTWPSGNTIQVRGYEPKALKELSNLYSEEEIKMGFLEGSQVPKIPYISSAGVSRRYYPDIFIPHENRIIEVKSWWWYDAHGNEKYEDRLYDNLAKKDASIRSGYKFEFWIYDEKGKKTIK